MKDTSVSHLFELLNRSLSPSRYIQKDEHASALGYLDRKSWLSVITMAEKNDISGLLYDAALSLPREQQPDREVMLRWMASIQSMERDNLLYRDKLIQGLTMLESCHLQPTILKGITIGELYPNPTHRPIGDVDIFVPIDEQIQYTECIKSMNGTIDNVFDLKHTSAQWNGLNWELHFRTMRFYNCQTESRYHLFEKEETSAENLCHQTIHGHTIQVLPPLFRIIYLTAHFQHHLLMERVSLRQVIDWMLVLHHERSALAISEQAMIRMLKQLGLYRLFRAMGYIAIHKIGYSSTGYAGLTDLSRRDAARGRYLLNILLRGHIPGCRPFQPHLVEDSFLARARHFWELCKRCIALYRLCPNEAAATPIGFIYYAIRRRLNKE